MGTLPQWLSGGATTAAVIFAVYTYRRSENDKRKAQARLVYALEVGPPKHYRAGATVHALLPEPNPDFWVTTVPPGSAPTVHKAVAEMWVHAIELFNGSNEVIAEVFGEMKGDEHALVTDSAIGGVQVSLRPGERVHTYVVYSQQPTFDEYPSRVPVIRFRDGAGVTWRRVMGEPVHERPFYSEPGFRDRLKDILTVRPIRHWWRDRSLPDPPKQ